MNELLHKMAERLPEHHQNLILAGLRGSHAHGTVIDPGQPNATNDLDVFGISVRPYAFYLGMGGWHNSQVNWDTGGDEFDILVYDLRKMVYLLSKGTPNTLDMLWLRPEDYFLVTPAGRVLLDNRDLFLTQGTLDALLGYAMSQFQKMERGAYEGYMGTRRKEMVDYYGYDIKNAAHCFRLLNLGIELITKGTMHSYRPDSEVECIKSIKRGELSFDEVREIVDRLFEYFQELNLESQFPARPDPTEVDRVLLTALAYAQEETICAS